MLLASDILKSANAYRIHQDLVRWGLLAGYATFFGATIGLLSTDGISKHYELLQITAVALFVIGSCYLFVLAVENWFYNAFAMHVADCEDRMHIDERPIAVGPWILANAEKVTPFHPSFFFAMLVSVTGNLTYLYIALDSFYEHPLWQTCMPKWAIVAGWLVGYLLLFFALFKSWNKVTYPKFIVKLQNLFKPLE